MADVADTLSPAAASRRAITTSGRPVSATFTVTVTAVSEVLACCPPGPPLRVATHDTASAAMRRPPGVTY